MAETAIRDGNFVTAMLFKGSDGGTYNVQGDEVTGRLKVDTSTGGILPISSGGTGVDSISAKSIWVANSEDVLVELTPAAGQSIRLNAGGTAWEVYTPVATGGLTWSEVTGTSQQASVNCGYVANNAALVTITLPDTAAVGDIIEIVGKGAGLWKVAQNASESINFGASTTTTGAGGSITATQRYQCIRLVCTVASTTWTVASAQGSNFTIV